MVSGKFPTPEPNEIDLAELQLQQELRALFEVDSQKYLQDYLNLVQHLQPQSWTRDIQELYRLIHTIKGSSVTVGADAILRVAAVLENMLSDLRHLNPAPPLSDGRLSQILLEAGELLASSLQVQATGEEALTAIQPSVQRIQTLQEQVKQIYLPEWNEQHLLNLEFAEQGFDLVVLDLEITLEQMPPQGEVSSETVEVAQQTLAQLTEIGKDLEFTGGWTELLHHCEDLLSRPRVEVWRSHLPGYLNALKECARQDGKYVEPEQIILPEPVESFLPEETEEIFLSDSGLLELSAIDESLLEDLDGAYEPRGRGRNQVPPLENPVPNSIRGTAPYELGEIAPRLPTEVELPRSSSEEILVTEPQELFQEELTEAADAMAMLELDSEIPTPAPEIPLAPETSEDWLGLVSPPPNQSAASQAAAESTIAALPLKPQSILPTSLTEAQTNDIQIPVPLNRLDRTAQSLVDALLTVRISQGLYQNLQAQLTQLYTLAKENAQYITRLRQLQDDYALLDKLKSSSNSAEEPTLERYRQGYSTINRLLETSLRLSELGAEAEKNTLLTADSWQSLERNILRLRQNVEQSRLVPFRNLVFRVRAILRDLTTRCGKPARLAVEGEQIELDAGTSSKLEPALLHLIRNAYDHGLENAEERIAYGKQEEGTITLSLKRRGNTYDLDVRDDGRGIDADAIRQSAEAKGLPLTSTQTPAQLLNVICQSGFSSKDAVSDISGRGVGMDVVAEQIASLGGRLSLVTDPRSGTTFRLQFPVPQLLMSCVLLQAGDCTLAIPTQDITTTTILDNLQATQVSDSNGVCTWKIQQGEETLLGLDLLEYWQPQAAKRSLPDTAVCIYVHPAQQSQGIWVLADELLGQTELLVTPLPSPLVSPIGILGASLQPNGSLVPVVEVATLVEVLLKSPAEVTNQLSAQKFVIETKAASILSEPEETDQDTRTILVVDDAALMRRRIEASLTAYGYTVNTCADGQEAWNWLSTHPTPAMVITDIEMPHIDGFTLIDRARQAGITIPFVVVSSRLAENWSKEARRLGATDYLTKGFSTYELINKVKSLLGSD
jgi:chemotaxis protein histidine kinase CheA/CheY-like chemotaxis protein